MCAEICQKKSNCVAWTYRNKPKKTQTCSIYSQYKDFASDKFSISGTNRCPIPSTPIVTETTTSKTTTTSISSYEYKDSKSLSIYINNGNFTAYKCQISIEVDLSLGMQLKVGDVNCEKETNLELAVNAEIGIYKFILNIDKVNITCQFAGVYKERVHGFITYDHLESDHELPK